MLAKKIKWEYIVAIEIKNPFLEGKNMKKIWKSLVCAVLSVAMVFALAACGGGFEAKMVEITGLEIESYGIAVQQGQDAALLAEINEVIADWTSGTAGETKIDQLVDYYSDVYDEVEAEAPFTLYLEGDSSASSTITMATEAGFAPFEFSDGNKIVGVDVAIMGQVAKNMGKKLVIYNIDFNSLNEAIFTSNRADCIAAGFTITPERAAAMDFSEPYFTSTQYIVCAEDADITSLADLAGEKIGAQIGTTGAQLVDNEIKNGVLKNTGAQLKEYQNAPTAFEDLKKGTIKAIVVDSVPATCLVAKTK